jgi:IS1 family transposase
MNRLAIEKRRSVVAALVEGNSIRATARMTAVSKDTVMKLLVDMGTVCSIHMDRELRDLDCKRVQVDEIWSFVYAKAKNVPEDMRDDKGVGDVWTWTALDSDSKLVLSYRVGPRDLQEAHHFMADVAKRLSERVQLTSDAFHIYGPAVRDAFHGDVDYAQLIKQYGRDQTRRKSGDAKYSPAICIGSYPQPITGDPDPAHISTSHVERLNLTTRMSVRRFTRLTNAFSKKVENHAAAVALHFCFYNYCRPHMSLGRKTTPAMAAGVTDHVWTIDELIALLDAAERVPVKRGKYKPRQPKVISEWDTTSRCPPEITGRSFKTYVKPAIPELLALDVPVSAFRDAQDHFSVRGMRVLLNGFVGALADKRPKSPGLEATQELAIAAVEPEEQTMAARAHKVSAD